MRGWMLLAAIASAVACANILGLEEAEPYSSDDDGATAGKDLGDGGQGTSGKTALGGSSGRVTGGGRVGVAASGGRAGTGAGGGSGAACAEGAPSSCVGSGSVRVCVDQTYQVRTCPVVCADLGLTDGPCTQMVCQCTGPRDLECYQGMKTYCECQEQLGEPCSAEVSLAIYLGCYRKLEEIEPHVRCFAEHAAPEGTVDCEAAAPCDVPL